MTEGRVTAPDDLDRINAALDLAVAVVAPFTPGDIAARMKSGDDPVTAADLVINEALRTTLPWPGEGWLSEETADDPARLGCGRVWVVDPLDGTREFVAGIPEWSVSVALVIDRRPVAGGIHNPATGQRIVGSVDDGVTLNGAPAAASPRAALEGALVLASRSEVKRGEWNPFFATPVSVRNVGSVAYKMALVAGGLADATWTLVPKHEWDVAAGTALVLSAGGAVFGPDGEDVTFNRPDTLLPGLVATGPALEQPVRDFLQKHRSA